MTKTGKNVGVSKKRAKRYVWASDQVKVEPKKKNRKLKSLALYLLKLEK